MTYTFASQTEAQIFADGRNSDAVSNDRYVATLYPDGRRPKGSRQWGVQRETRYADRPELGWINCGFVWHRP